MKTWHRFLCAVRGLVYTLTKERNGRIELVCAALVVAFGLWLDVSPGEWAVLALATAFVIAAECLNTAVERLANRVTTEREESIRIVKDAAAGGVLAAALGAALAALAIFGPKLCARFVG
jgi:diacylglycerol kinase